MSKYVFKSDVISLLFVAVLILIFILKKCFMLA